MKKEQKILNARLRLALRTGDLPFVFEDDQERNYRKIVYEMGRELKQKFTVRKVGTTWSIDIHS
jgi:hypothetical protein